jgi:DNA polymerase
MIYLDFETRSFTELSGKKGVGTWQYSLHPTTTVLCLAYKFDDEPTQIWDPWPKSLDHLRKRKTVWDPRYYPHVLFERITQGEKLCAHNAFFERAIWENVCVKRWGWPSVKPEQWVCSMAASRAYGLPGKLELAGKTLGLSLQKGSQKAMRRMMKPRAAWLRNGKGDIWFGTPEDYAELCEYCKLDVDVEYELYHAIDKLTPREQRIWALDQTINLRGVGIDRRLADGAWTVFDAKRKRGAASLADITNNAVETPNQIARISAWVTSQGVDMPNCQAQTVKDLLALDLPDNIRQVLEIRQSVGGAAALKYDAFRRYASSDDRVRGELQYYGAHTGRWTSSGVQLHNAVKNKMDPEEAEKLIPCFYGGSENAIATALALKGVKTTREVDNLITTLVRSVIVADADKILVDVDYAAIEARVMAWLAGERALLAQFREFDRTGDPSIEPYRIAAADIMGIDPRDVDKDQRAFGKVMILAPQYGMGVDRFLETCHSWGLKWVDLPLAEKAIGKYRTKYWRTKNYWYEFETAIKNAMVTGEAWHKQAHIVYDREKQLLGIALPNGRWLWYHKCVIKDGRIQYFGRLPPPKSGYGTVYSWGGKFTENYDQALSRDYMALAMLRVDQIPGVEVLLTVHDEILMQVPLYLLDELLPLIKKAVTPRPLWAKGLPINIGYWTGKGFKKD